MGCCDDGDCGCGGQKKDGFTVPTPASLKCSLGQSLIPVVDKARDLLTQMGFRPYRVRIVRTRFAGPRRGMGPEVVVHELELLPTPKVVDLSALTQEVTAIGVNDGGTVQLQKVSGRYTEETLLGVSPTGEQIPSNEAVYYEVEFFRRDGGPSEKRRFIRGSVPHWDAEAFQWSITLTKTSDDNRLRDGSPKG